jgi:hypothetical protein
VGNSKPALRAGRLGCERWAVRTTHRASVAGGAALVAFWYVYGSWLLWSGYSTDFDQIYWAADAMIRGYDTYERIADINRQAGVPWSLLYPMPAVVAGSLVRWMPLEIARAAVAAVSAGALAWFLTGRPGQWPVLLSGAMRSSVSLVQFTPFLACAAVTPWFGWAIACKPQSGLAVLASVRTRYHAAVACGVAGALVLASFIAAPGWLAGWLEAISGAHYLKPWLMRPGGVVLLLAALRWRRPEARWLLVTACIPSTANIYEALPLLVLGAWTRKELLVLGILSHVADIGGYIIRANETYPALVQAHGVTVLWLFYVPTLLLILRRPNEVAYRAPDPRAARLHHLGITEAS